jgi:lipooligosaccharide transport system permease protein
VRVTPLYQGVALERSLVLGDITWLVPVHVAYLAAMGTIGLRIASRRLVGLIQP